MAGLIKRDDALMCLTGDITGMTIEQYIAMAEERIKALPDVPLSQLITLYGFKLETLLWIATVMKSRGIGPSEAIDLISDSTAWGRAILEEVESEQRKAFQKMMNEAPLEVFDAPLDYNSMTVRFPGFGPKNRGNGNATD